MLVEPRVAPELVKALMMHEVNALYAKLDILLLLTCRSVYIFR